MNDQLLLTVSGAARLMGFDRKIVGQMCRRFELRWVPRGRLHKRIPRSEVERWIREHTVSNPSELRKALDGRRK